MSEDDAELSRRALLAALAGAGLTADACAHAQRPAAGDTMIGVRFEPRARVRVGVIGTGQRGTGHVRELLGAGAVEVVALCDVVEARARGAAALCAQAGRPPPALFTRGERDFQRLCRLDELDAVWIATPWEWHVPMAVAAMNAGKHAFVEVPAATTLEECWTLVDTSERTRRHCVMLENCCYGETELLVLDLVRAGVLGEIVHAEAAYLHDLRALLRAPEGESQWRNAWLARVDGNLYPTHGLGPVARYLDIERGDRFDHLVSMSSAARALPGAACGDMNVSLIRTARGRTIVLQHDVVSPRPYSRINLVTGTRGTFADFPPRVYVDGQPGGEQWASVDDLRAKYQHELWRQRPAGGGHGGMDTVMTRRVIQWLREGLVPDMDVYDAASWSAPFALSAASVAQGSAPVKFPDFTRGLWRGRRPDGA